MTRLTRIDAPRVFRTALSGVSHVSSGIAAGDLVESYINADHLAAVVDDYLLSPAVNGRDANVVLHVVSMVFPSGIGRSASLILAADLSEHRGPREEARAAKILREIGGRNPKLVAERPKSSRARKKARA